MEHKQNTKSTVEHKLTALLSSCFAVCGTHLILPFQTASRFWNGRRPLAALPPQSPEGGLYKSRNRGRRRPDRTTLSPCSFAATIAAAKKGSGKATLGIRRVAVKMQEGRKRLQLQALVCRRGKPCVMCNHIRRRLHKLVGSRSSALVDTIAFIDNLALSLVEVEHSI